MGLRIGFLGAGFIARYHAMQLRLAVEANDIVAVFDPDPERAAAFCDEESGLVVDSAQDVIASSDAVFVCTWTAAHLEGVREAVAAGRPVFCEKPLSTDVEGARELVDLVRGSGLPNAVGLVLRSTPAMHAMRELIRDPDSGRVMNVVFRDDQYLPTQGMYGSRWRGERTLAGAGTLLEHSIHDVDILEWLVGPLSSVSAHHDYFHGIDGIEDSVTVMTRFAEGGSGSLHSIWHEVLSRPSQRRVEVFCEHAMITLEGEFFGPVRRQTSDEELLLDGDQLIGWLQARDVDLRSTEQDFLVQVRNHLEGRPVIRVRPDVDDALRAHEVIDAIYRSAASGVAVELDPSGAR
ncbi:MAG: Gfo/Idh/MocA family oxidoreductase [Microthrixaceae bacterium]